MALFEISMQEQSDMGLWMRSVQRELQSNTHIKSSFYGFDFVQGNPLPKSKRFDWVDDESKFIYGERDLSTRPSSNIHHEDFSALFNSPDSVLDIPDMQVE